LEIELDTLYNQLSLMEQSIIITESAIEKIKLAIDNL
jgi:hypothetical protein